MNTSFVKTSILLTGFWWYFLAHLECHPSSPGQTGVAKDFKQRDKYTVVLFLKRIDILSIRSLVISKCLKCVSHDFSFSLNPPEWPHRSRNVNHLNQENGPKTSSLFSLCRYQTVQIYFNGSLTTKGTQACRDANRDPAVVLFFSVSLCEQRILCVKVQSLLRLRIRAKQVLFRGERSAVPLWVYQQSEYINRHKAW